jgi:predicted ATPase with chaperone activity
MQATNRFGTLCAVTLAAAGLLVMPAANAQQQSPPAPPVTTPSPTTTPATIADKKLDAAAAAVKKVTVIKNKYNQQLAEAPVAEKERIQGEAGDAMAKAVTEQGLSVEEYMTILKVAQQDPVVRDKLIERMK